VDLHKFRGYITVENPRSIKPVHKYKLHVHKAGD